MKILKNYCKEEYFVKNSKFISELIPCENQNQAREIVKNQKQKYFDSTHVVHAFVLGLNHEIMGMSDDGEPSGTAGRPALDILKGSDCTNFVLTITRYFGGTLLGTGGLVKAYGDGAKIALKKAEESNLFEEYIEKTKFSFKCDYSIHKTIKHFMKDFTISDLAENFSSNVELSGLIVSKEFEDFKKKLINLSNGKIIVV